MSGALTDSQTGSGRGVLTHQVDKQESEDRSETSGCGRPTEVDIGHTTSNFCQQAWPP